MAKPTDDKPGSAFRRPEAQIRVALIPGPDGEPWLDPLVHILHGFSLHAPSSSTQD